jgi:hypothetical protein
MRAAEEKLGMEALADQPPLHIRHASDDRVDLAAIGRRPQLLQRQCARHLTSGLDYRVKTRADHPRGSLQ